jgi:hypothetical protein
MTLYILIAIATLIVIVCVVAALKPKTFRWHRSMIIRGSTEQVYAQIVDLRRWQAWSPYEQVIKSGTGEIQRVYAGSDAGVGAVYEWKSNSKKIGAGRMTIIEASPSSRILIDLEFMVPFKAHNQAEFTIFPTITAGEVSVTWAMFGPSPFVSRLMGVFVNFENMICKDFETGLANLQQQVSV